MADHVRKTPRKKSLSRKAPARHVETQRSEVEDNANRDKNPTSVEEGGEVLNSTEKGRRGKSKKRGFDAPPSAQKSSASRAASESGDRTKGTKGESKKPGIKWSPTAQNSSASSVISEGRETADQKDSCSTQNQIGSSLANWGAKGKRGGRRRRLGPPKLPLGVREKEAAEALLLLARGAGRDIPRTSKHQASGSSYDSVKRSSWRGNIYRDDNGRGEEAKQRDPVSGSEHRSSRRRGRRGRGRSRSGNSQKLLPLGPLKPTDAHKSCRNFDLNKTPPREEEEEGNGL